MHRVALAGVIAISSLLAMSACSVLVGGEDLSSSPETLPLLPERTSEPAHPDAGATPTPEPNASDGGCSDHECGPVRIFTAPAGAVARDWPIASSGGRVTFGYATTGDAGAVEGHLVTLRTDGSALVENARGASVPARLVVDDKYVYVTMDAANASLGASVRRIDRAVACTLCTLQGIGNQTAGSVAFNGTDVVWSTKADRVIRTVALAGGTARYLPATPSAAFEMALDPADGSVFVLFEASGTSASSIKLLKKGTSVLETFVIVANAKDIAVDATSVYAVTSAGAVFKYPKPAGAARSLAFSLPGIQHVAVDGALLYVTRTTGATGSIDAVRTDGAGNPTNIATTPTSPRGIAVDATAIYWTDSTGSVWKRSK